MVVMSRLTLPFADPAALRARTVALTAATSAVTIVVARLSVRGAGDAVDLVVLAVLLSISFTRERRGATARQRLLGAVALPLVGIAASAVGALMVGVPVVGDALYVVVVSGAIWLRRFGATAQRVGTLVALPFVAVLVAPVPVRPSAFFPLEAAVVALAVVVVGGALDVLARATGFLVPPAAEEAARPVPVTPSTSGARSSRGARRRLPGSTKMAVQMAVGLSVAFVAGHLIFGEHWPWLVLTAYIVASGNRGRADVLYKGVLRVAGALAGTVIGTVVALVGHAGDPVLLVALAAILLIALWLRPVGYAWWAAGVTCALALLYDYTGQTASHGGIVLLVRLAAVVAGGMIAGLAATLVLPIRTVEVVRLRASEALRALSAVLVAVRAAGEDPVAPRTADGELRDAERAYDAAVERLQQVAPALRAHRAVTRRALSHPATLIELVGETVPLVRVVVTMAEGGALDQEARTRVGLLARRVGDLRRSLGGVDDAPSPALASVSAPGPDGAPCPDGAVAELLALADRIRPEIAAVRRDS